MVFTLYGYKVCTIRVHKIRSKILFLMKIAQLSYYLVFIMADTVLFYGLFEFLMKISCRKYPIFNCHVALIHFRVVLIRFHVVFIHFRVTFTLSHITTGINFNLPK